MAIEADSLFHQILVPWDGSEPATRAFTIAADLASKYHSQLRVLSVLPRFDDVETSVEGTEATRMARERLVGRRQALYRIAQEHGVEAELDELAAHHAADAIVDYAHEHGFDLIVMGRRGTSLAGIRRFLLGSTSDKVMRYAGCPVLIVSDIGAGDAGL